MTEMLELPDIGNLNKTPEIMRVEKKNNLLKYNVLSHSYNILEKM